MTLQWFGNSGVTFYLLCSFWYFLADVFHLSWLGYQADLLGLKLLLGEEREDDTWF